MQTLQPSPMAGEHDFRGFSLVEYKSKKEVSSLHEGRYARKIAGKFGGSFR